MERTSLFLVQSLPGISRWFEVDKREVVRPAACSRHWLVAAAHRSPALGFRRLPLAGVPAALRASWHVCTVPTPGPGLEGGHSCVLVQPASGSPQKLLGLSRRVWRRRAGIGPLSSLLLCARQ